MNEVISYDMEVFAHDTLLGADVITSNGTTRFQSWNLDEIRAFYYRHQDAIWIGHNIDAYDNLILQTIIRGGNEELCKAKSDSIIHGNGIRSKKLDIKLYHYDLTMNHMCKLKAVEAFMGKNISETQVDFNLTRKLTDEEKRLTESYNGDDLDQNLEDFIQQKGEVLLRLDIINEFHLPLSCLSMTGTQIAEVVLKAKKIDGIENDIKLPVLWPTLRIKNQEALDFYLNRRWLEKISNGNKSYAKTINFSICGTPHKLAAGGLHGAKPKIHWDFAYYFDVSGYYNLIMIIFDLLPRSIPQEGRELYKYMYKEQLRLKKIDPQKRGVYKTILLSVFGAMNNEYCKFYDPSQGDLVRMTGQMFLIDLLEKLEGKVEVAQSNTDGIIARPLPGVSEQELIDVVNEWQERTGFVLKLEKIYDLHQRDVNCYFYRDSNDEIHTLGEAVKDYGKWEYIFWAEAYKSKEPVIMPTAIVEYYMFGKLPEQVINEHKRNLRMFQYICKQVSYDWLEYRLTDASGQTSVTKLQGVNRAFAMKNESNLLGMVYKCKKDGAKAKVSNLPPSVFVYDNEILSDETVDKLQDKIDYDYYIKRAYERISEFKDIPQIKNINL